METPKAIPAGATNNQNQKSQKKALKYSDYFLNSHFFPSTNPRPES